MRAPLAILITLLTSACGAPDDLELLSDAGGRDASMLGGRLAPDAPADGAVDAGRYDADLRDAEPTPCEIGESRCVDNGTFERCLRDRTWAPRDCDEGMACVDAVGECRVVVCTPGEVVCDDAENTTFSRCLPDGSAWVHADCREGQRCGVDGCIECDQGESVCLDDETMQQCDPAGTLTWSAPETCRVSDICLRGRCRHRNCISRVLLLVDRSARMAPDWPRVAGQIRTVANSYGGDVYFGLMGYPSDDACGIDVPITPPAERGPIVFVQWMRTFPPAGGAPLLAAMSWVSAHRDRVWGQVPDGHMIVISSGSDTCASPGTAEPAVADAADRLARQGIRTHVIGYDVPEDDVDELDAIARNGNTDLAHHIGVGNPTELADALHWAVDGTTPCPDP